MALFNFKKKKQQDVTEEMNFIVDDSELSEEEAGVTKTFDVEGDVQPQVEKTAVFQPVEQTIEEQVSEATEEVAMDLQEDDDLDDTDTTDLEDLEEDEDYEYVTPQYGRKAFKLTIFCMLVGAIASFIIFNGQMQKDIRELYQKKGYALTQIGATATAADIREGKTAYVLGNLVEGTYIELDTSLATATAGDILAGYTAYVNGTKITGTIPTYTGASMITPSTKDFKINKGTYLPEGIIVSGEVNLAAANIKAGVKLFGITGNYK